MSPTTPALSQPKRPFVVVPLENDEDWNVLSDLCDGYLPEYTIAKFRRLLRHSCATVIVERNYFCKDYRDTFTHFYSKKFSQLPSTAHRLLFFGDAFAQENLWDVESYANSFIGYSVIRPTLTNCIGRTVLDPDKCADVKGHMCLTTYKANLLGYPLKVKGFPFIGQDADVTVCAHAACWMCFRYFSEKYNNYSETYPFQITQLTEYSREGRLVPTQGLRIEQVVEIFQKGGFSPRIYVRSEWDYEGPEAGFFDRLLYTYIESGLPLVLSVPQSHHIVTAFGHQSDFTLIPPTGERIFSSFYMSSVIINDDNAMPYETIQVLEHKVVEHKVGENDDGDVALSTEKIGAFIVPLPEKVFLCAEDVERRTDALLNDEEVGLQAHSSLSYDDLVVRIFLTSARAYKEARRASGLPNGLHRVYAATSMSRFIWVAEIATKAEYCSGNVRGEIIFDATASARDRYPFIAIHYPETLLLRARDDYSSGLFVGKLPVQDAYPVYRHNLEEIPYPP